MTDIIKVKFLRDGQPSGREYTFYSPEAVAVGDTVDLQAKTGIAHAVVTQVNVLEEEISSFRDSMKSILGKTKDKDEQEAVS